MKKQFEIKVDGWFAEIAVRVTETGFVTTRVLSVSNDEVEIRIKRLPGDDAEDSLLRACKISGIGIGLFRSRIETFELRVFSDWIVAKGDEPTIMTAVTSKDAE